MIVVNAPLCDVVQVSLRDSRRPELWCVLTTHCLRYTDHIWFMRILFDSISW